MFDTMCSLGISYIQGYYFSKPIPEQEFLEFVKAKKKENADKGMGFAEEKKKTGCM